MAEHRVRCGWGGAIAVVLAAAPMGPAGASIAPKKVSFEVTVVGPRRVAPGATATFQGRYWITGQQKTMDDLGAIGAALQRYHAANGSYPPAALRNADGVDTVSWRVLLLPYLGLDSLYRRFDVSKPWNDPVNKALLAQMPDVYRGAGQKRGATVTGYAGVAGPKNLFRGSASTLGGGIQRANVTDGPDMTIAVGPVGASVQLPWSAPGDITVTAASELGAADGFSGAGGVITPLLFLDGAVRPMPDDVGGETVSSWATVAGGGCAPPAGLQVPLGAAWDLDGNGTFEAAGRTATFVAAAKGSRTIAFRVIDATGVSKTVTTRITIG